MHFILGVATGGKNEQIVRHILYNRKLSFPNGGRRNWRNYFENEGVFADIGSCPPVPNALRWCGLGRPMQDREKIFRAFLVKSVYDFPTTKLLIENLRTNPSLRRLCGWEYSGAVPSEATFSRAFSEFATEQILEEVHRCIIKENYREKLVGHSSIDSTAISSREKSVQKKPVPA